MRLAHRLLLLRYGIRPDLALNRGPEPSGEMPSVAADLLRIVRQMEVEAYDVKAGRVDYARLSGSPTYAEYRQCARRLQSFDPGALESHEERLAFWINLYNALVVDAVIQFGVRRTVNEVPGFFWRAAYLIGGQRCCAHDVEHGILRANASYPAIPGRHFGSHDSRRRFSLERLDQRVHFALVCAARSCPPIAVYAPAQINSQLDLAVRVFVNSGGVETDASAGEVRLSQIFRWYAPDFGGRWLATGSRRPLLEFVSAYLKLKDDRRFVLESRRLRVRFLPYDWSLNHADTLS